MAAVVAVIAVLTVRNARSVGAKPSEVGYRGEEASNSLARRRADPEGYFWHAAT